MSANAKATDRCPCGAEFHAEGEQDWVAARWEKWLEAHHVCRITASVRSAEA